MKKEFKYQLLWLRVLGAVPVGCLVFIIQEYIIHKMISSNLVYGFDIAIILIALSFYYCITERQTWFLRSGELCLKGGSILIKSKTSETLIPAEQVKELFLQKKSLLGSEFVLLQIKWNKKSLKMYSNPIVNQEDVSDSEFYELYQFIIMQTDGLTAVKDIWGENAGYWMKKAK